MRRVDKRNALTVAMYGELADILTKANDDDTIKAVVFTAEGADFCAGNDLGEFMGDYTLFGDSPWRRFVNALPKSRKPLIASVHGNAVGIGLTMLLHFDLVYVEPSARLSAPFGRLGVAPEAGSSGLLAQFVGPQRAREAFLLGRTFSADEAVRFGIACAVVAEGSGRATALEAAKKIAKLPPYAVSSIRGLCAKQFASIEARLDAECAAFMDCLGRDETRAILSGLASRVPRA